ncbi:MAG: hypothetical protein KF870_01465 [Leadbetterella sp.]|nr:hypothetical protein [Leadbetterella sp.]
MNRITFHDTHVYPGCLANFHFGVNPGSHLLSALAEFSDGASAEAEVEPLSSGEVIIRVEGYTTTRKTPIPGKAWRLTHDKTRDLWKVTGKI